MYEVACMYEVAYAPKLPSVSVSPSAEIEEGSSVTLTCSSDANPAANYTWYKEDEDSPKASGQIFTITDFRAEHSGSYSCGAQNKLRRSNSTFHLIVVAGSSTMIVNIIRTRVLMLIPVFLLSLWTRKKKALRSTTEAHESEEIELDSDPEYENDSHTAAQTEDRGAGRHGVKSSQIIYKVMAFEINKTTIVVTGAFLDAFQKVADMAMGTRGATKEIGSALTRMCMRHRSIESKLKLFTTALSEGLVSPLELKMEEWKKVASQLDKDHAKEYKKARADIKKKSSDTIKLQKKVKK
ncbi:hypothetical protein JOQ06_014758, partial [Pogonophryne albipinna]